ncbi:MAG: hypothetical protein Phyf2KO_07500 [Phycisphaerales bacterium]
MEQIKSCPSAEELERLVHGSATQDEIDALADHLNECAACQKVIEHFSRDSAFEHDLHWANEVRTRTVVDVGEPLSRLNSILSEYELVAELGRGGMGIVYRAIQPKLNREVAIKVLPALMGMVRPEAKARFKREAELAASLDHTNIISIHDYGEADGTLFYAMQLIRGRSLRDILDEISQSGAVDCVVGEATGSGRHERGSSGGMGAGRKYYKEIAHWIAEVADALEYAHQHGVIHRDIKPSNLLVAEDGKLMISDFGLARPAESHSFTRSQSLIGTCRYMAPEQLNPESESHDHRVDVYALGATLYELLAFKPMFVAADDRQIIHMIHTRDPSKPSKYVKTVPKELETICLKAVAKNSGERYQTASAFADDLRRWMLDLPINARQQNTAQRCVKLMCRHKLTSVLVAVLLLLAGASAVFWGMYDSAREEGVLARDAESVQKAMLLVRDADDYIDREEYDSAIAMLDEALVVEPELSEAVHEKARVLARMGLLGESKALLEAAVARDDDDWKASYQLGMVLHEIHEQGGLHIGDAIAVRRHEPLESTVKRSAAIGALLATVERAKPDSVEVLCLQTTIEPDHVKAIELLEQALAIDPRFTDAHVELAGRLRCIGRFDAAISRLEEAIELKRGGHRVYGMYGIALTDKRRFAEAERAFGAAIERNPSNVDWWYDRAVARTYIGQFAGAVEDARQAISLDPAYEDAYVALGRGLAGLGDANQALESYDRAAELNPNKPDVYMERGVLHWFAGRYDKSLADANKLIEIIPNQTSGYQRRAQTYLKLEQWDKALADLDVCDQIDTDDIATPTIRGGVLYYAGRYDEAAVAFAKGQQVSPNTYGNYNFHVLCMIRTGQYSAGIAPATNWITLANNSDLGLLRRGMVYEALGQHDLALLDYSSAMESDRLGCYPYFWTACHHLVEGDATLAASVLEQCEGQARSQRWSGLVLAALLGEVDPDHLVREAGSAMQLAEAHYYAGVVCQSSGDFEKALDHYEASIATDSGDTFELDLAWIRRDLLAASIVSQN